MKKGLIVFFMFLSVVALSAVIQQNDFTPAENDTIPADFTSDWDAGTDVKVLSLATLGVAADHTGGDGYALRIADLGDTGYNFAYPASYATASHADSGVEAWVYLDFAPYSDERDCGLAIRCGVDTTPSFGAQAIYSDMIGYWFLVTVNSSWGSYVPTNRRGFFLKKISGVWAQVGTEGASDVTDGWHKIRVEAQGTTLRAFIDDVLYLTVEDTENSFTTGFVAMTYYRATDDSNVGIFDNFLWDTEMTDVSDWELY